MGDVYACKEELGINTGRHISTGALLSAPLVPGLFTTVLSHSSLQASLSRGRGSIKYFLK